jgi:hypothetical protein
VFVKLIEAFIINYSLLLTLQYLCSI